MARQNYAIEEALRQIPAAQLAAFTPLDMLLFLMRECARLGDRAGAHAAAVAAAPFLHPRLNATDLQVHHTYGDKSDTELQAELAKIECKLLASQTINGILVEPEAGVSGDVSR